MLIHRRNCVDQFQIEIIEANKTDVIDIRTYQSIEAVERSGVLYNLEQYDYIVADEFHYFFGDASFNKYTDISFNAILRQVKAIKIFMSATGDDMKKYLNGDKHLGLTTRDYEIPIDFSFIKYLEFFYEDKTFETYIEQAIKHNRKAIFFIQSATKAYELHEKYKEHSMFNCGKGSRHYRHVDEDKVKAMLKNEKFDDLILFTTAVFDAGVNIVDDELHHIYIDMNDTGSLIQCLGRKRLKDKNDYVVLYVKAIGGQQLGGLESKLHNEVKMPLHLFKEGDKSMVKEYYRKYENSDIVYDFVNKDGHIEKKVNELMFFKTVTDALEIEKIKDMGKNGYCDYISKIFNMSYTIREEEEGKKSLGEYLNSIVGKKLFKEEQEELKEVFAKNGLKARTLGINTLNGNLKDRKMSFVIQAKRTSERSGRKVKSIRYWEVDNDIDVG